jgi:hypothetical protein
MKGAGMVVLRNWHDILKPQTDRCKEFNKHPDALRTADSYNYLH